MLDSLALDSAIKSYRVKGDSVVVRKDCQGRGYCQLASLLRLAASSPSASAALTAQHLVRRLYSLPPTALGRVQQRVHDHRVLGKVAIDSTQEVGREGRLGELTDGAPEGKESATHSSLARLHTLPTPRELSGE